MIRRPPRSTLSSSSAASDVYKRQLVLAVGTCFEPSFRSAIGIGAHFFEFFLIKFSNRYFFQLFNYIIKLSSDIYNVFIIHFRCIVIWNVYHYKREIMHTRYILIQLHTSLYRKSLSHIKAKTDNVEPTLL